VTPRERISHSIRAACARGEPALIAYLTAGFPAREKFREHLRAIAAVADVVEVGVPFTDPMADGVTIQRASLAALAQGVSLSWILAELEALGEMRVPLLLMSYLNPLLAFGPTLAVRARGAGVAGFIVPDLPLDESSELRAALDAEGLALVQMVTPVTEPERLKQLCAGSQGFVYAVTMTGTTGKNVAVPEDVVQYLDRVRAAAALPVCAGFGIRSREQVARLRDHVDGVVVGSALVEQLERGADVSAWLRSLRPGT
jgi:tryptophan synthase alpha chain